MLEGVWAHLVYLKEIQVKIDSEFSIIKVNGSIITSISPHSDLLGNNVDNLLLMENVNNLGDFDFVISLSAGDPGSKQWVQFGTDPSNLPFTTGCTSIQVTDIIPYVENDQILGILEGMPGAAEYESLVEVELKAMGLDLVPGKASSMMSAQSIAHIIIVLFIIFGNISYFSSGREGRKKS